MVTIIKLLHNNILSYLVNYCTTQLIPNEDQKEHLTINGTAVHHLKINSHIKGCLKLYGKLLKTML